MINKRTEKLIAAPFTPFNGDGSKNIEIISVYAEKLKIDRLSGVFICFTTDYTIGN